MNTNDFISDVTFNLSNWGISYSENTTGLTVGAINLEALEEEPVATITNGDDVVAITSDADKAAALLAFPLARKAWEDGYMGGFEVDTQNNYLDMCLSCGSSDVIISATIDSDIEFTVTEHPLLRESVDMTDLEAVLESTQLAYRNPEAAWRALCNATDFEQDDWSSIVELLHWQARFEYGDEFTKVSTSESKNVALVEDYNPEHITRVINVDAVTDVACLVPSDVAAAVLYAIA